jgi:hypothetical protein
VSAIVPDPGYPLEQAAAPGPIALITVRGVGTPVNTDPPSRGSREIAHVYTLLAAGSDARQIRTGAPESDRKGATLLACAR